MYRNIVFQALLAALLAAGCDDCKEGTPDTGPGAIAGTVFRLNGDPVADAQVYIRDNVFRYTTSKGDGTYELSNLSAGDYVVVAVGPEGVGASAEARVAAGLTTGLDLVLSAGGSLAGVVKLEGEQDHSGTLVYFPGLSFAGYTVRDGRFLIDSIIPGCYTVRVEHAGFHPDELERVCIVVREQTILPDMTLQKHTLPDCTSDSDCGPHQVCENRICSYEAGYGEEICDGKDNDGDGYVDEGVAQPCEPSKGVCSPGFSLCLGGEMSECQGGILPRDERCDLLDNDCDGLTDEDFDADGDDYTSCGGDCDDTDPAINPEAAEVCDLKDNDCDGRLDEGCPVECNQQLAVTVITAADRQPLAGAHITVVDNAGAAHTADTDAAGVASFTSLATGPRRSITVNSDETTPPLPGPGGPDRPRYETTTVLGPCTDEITIPLRLTASGRSTPSMGTIVGKVPESVFAMLPHSWKCDWECRSDSDCNERYHYCELDETTPCGPTPENPGTGRCTWKSLLSFYDLGDPYISGQMRAAMLVPVLPQASYAYRDSNKVLAPPPFENAILPGNFATDDSFLRGLARSLGLDPWGDTCVQTSDCPNSIDYVCEQDFEGDYRCKDKNPLHNIRMRVPAGSTRLAMVLGVMDVDLSEMLPVLMSYLTSNSEVEFDFGSLLGAFKLHTLHVCPIMVSVTADTDNDITTQLNRITLDGCWSVDYNEVESTVARNYPIAQSIDSCETDNDCCDDSGNCGWPDSYKKCLEDPEGSGVRGCFAPMFRIDVVSGDAVKVLPPATGFDPTATKADNRLCTMVPASAPYEVMCPTPTPGEYRQCDPRDIRELDVPPDHECSFPYGVALATLDFPVGHPRLPEGGRVFIGYDFNRSPLHHRPEPEFMVPFGIMDESVELSVTQVFLRNLSRMENNDLRPVPGRLTARVSSHYPVAGLQLPPLVKIPALQPPPGDAGFDVKVVFEAEDPSVFPPVLERVYAVAKASFLPQAGVHELAYELNATSLEGEDLVGVVLSRVDYPGALVYVDPWWRVYAPPGTTSISLPPEASPFTSGEFIRLTPFGSDLEKPFNYDLFPVDAVLGPRRAHVEDSWAVVVP